ncbi:hypothetical protein LR48_Vigan01g031200 [Vigna angularis]|uniref:Uncharacterized protein n=1 Tax=Phaseolus angularis TaxID=3914 RepID=A0A0L9TJZ3_PHAAN|nr:hypothetical protein LR48_Vigan01g031200 [Vigna angularis]
MKEKGINDLPIGMKRTLGRNEALYSTDAWVAPKSNSYGLRSWESREKSEKTFRTRVVERERERAQESENQNIHRNNSFSGFVFVFAFVHGSSCMFLVTDLGGQDQDLVEVYSNAQRGRASGGRCVRDVRNWYKAIWTYGLGTERFGGRENCTKTQREREGEDSGFGEKSKGVDTASSDLDLESSSSHRRASTIGSGKERQGPEEEGEEVTGYSQLAAAIELQESATFPILESYSIRSSFSSKHQSSSLHDTEPPTPIIHIHPLPQAILTPTTNIYHLRPFPLRFHLQHLISSTLTQFPFCSPPHLHPYLPANIHLVFPTGYHLQHHHLHPGTLWHDDGGDKGVVATVMGVGVSVAAAPDDGGREAAAGGAQGGKASTLEWKRSRKQMQATLDKPELEESVKEQFDNTEEKTEAKNREAERKQYWEKMEAEGCWRIPTDSNWMEKWKRK